MTATPKAWPFWLLFRRFGTLRNDGDFAATFVNQIEDFRGGLQPSCAAFHRPIRVGFGKRAKQTLNKWMEAVIWFCSNALHQCRRIVFIGEVDFIDRLAATL